MASAGIAELAFAIQTAKGSPAAASTRRIYLSGGSLPSAKKATSTENYVRSTRIAGEAFTGSVPATGAPEAFVRPGMIGAILYAVLGAKAVSGASDPWTHTFTMGASLPYLTFWRHFAGLFNERISDARLSRVTLSGRSGQPLRVLFEILSGVPVHRTAQETSVTVETSDTFFMHHGSGALKIEGTAISSISAFTLTIDAAVALVETLAGPVPLLAGRSSIRMQVDQAIVDASLWNRLIFGSSSPSNLAAPVLTPLELAGSPAGFEFTFTEQASPERSLKLAIPRVILAEMPDTPPSTAYDLARMQPVYEAIAPAGGVSPLTATLKNAVSAY